MNFSRTAVILRYWDVVSSDAKDFIRKLLNRDSDQRLTAQQAMLHPWLIKGDHELLKIHLEKTVRQLKDFNGRRKFNGIYQFNGFHPTERHLGHH